ncbi:MAG: DEAD/DEAH box helicase [Bdellovibrionota bacterium]
MTISDTDLVNEPDSIFSLLPAQLRESLQKQGISKPTSIQQAAYAPIMQGKDLIAQSRTGSGKTLAFGLPAFARLDKPKAAKPRLLVLTPTRELTQQVADVFEVNFKPLGYKILAITGGSSYRFQISSLNRGVDAIVATPGRLNDLLQQKVLDLTAVEILVLDEMDEMLDFGFADDILKIRDCIGKKAQTLLFSATFPPKVTRMSKQMVSQPHEIKIASTDTTTGSIEHEFIEVKMGRNLDALLGLLLYYSPEHAIIFCKTREETKNIYNVLLERGVAVGVLNGEMTQNDRSATMERFKNKQTKILVATDVAARGIDVTGLSHVINYSVPKNIEAYTHRSGRTGRAGATGKSWSLVAYNERREYQFICSKVKINPVRLEIPNPKKIVNQFIKNKLFQIETNVAQCSPLISDSVTQFVDALDMEGLKSSLAHILKAEISHQIGKTLQVDDISPAFKTEFGANVEQKFAGSPSGNGGGGRGGYSSNRGGGGGYQGRGGDNRSQQRRGPGSSSGAASGASQERSYSPANSTKKRGYSSKSYS